jgi:hypothetical protein
MFHTLQMALMEAPFLAIPDFVQQFAVDSHMCQTGICADLMQ